jgi:ActR/RegA family two-component response regulator
MSVAGVSAQLIDFEVTETTLLRDRERARKALYELREAGSHLALDDFGTGYSSLTFLRDFPVGTLKLDRSFVMDVNSDVNAATIARTVIGMARSLQMRVVAEGVETAAQLQFLDRYRCDEMQGYLFSKPLPEESFRRLLDTGQQLDLAGHGVHRLRTLLILDDEESVLNALRRTFRRDGYRLLFANNTDDALALMDSNDVQVIIAEQRLKGVSGIDFLKQVKTLHPETIRIILSGYTELSAVVNAVNQGAVYKFLTKPWKDEELREQIRDVFLQHEAKFICH